MADRLLDQIQRDALDSRVPLADTLRKLIALGGEAGSSELRDWASHELKGYGSAELPSYRRIPATIRIDGVNPGVRVTGQRISTMQLPSFAREVVNEEVPMGHGIGEIEAMTERAEEGEIRLSPPGAQDLVVYMNSSNEEPFQHITSLYWSVSVVSLRGLVDRVRTTLVELVAEIQAGLPPGVSTPSGELANQAVNIVIHDGGRAEISSAQVAGSGSHDTNVAGSESHDLHVASENRSRWRVIGAGIAGTAGVVAALIALAQWQGWGP